MYFPAFGLNAKYISVRVNETKITTENASNQVRLGLDQPRPYRNFFFKKINFRLRFIAKRCAGNEVGIRW